MKNRVPTRRVTLLVCTGAAVTLAVCAAMTIVGIWNAESQAGPRDGLYPGNVFIEIDASGDASRMPFSPGPVPGGEGNSVTSYRPVRLFIQFARYGTERDIYYDRLTVGTANARPPLPPPPAGWGTGVTSNLDKLKNRPEFAAVGLEGAAVDWLAVGRGETWTRTRIAWPAVVSLIGRSLVLGVLLGSVAAFAVSVIRETVERRRSARMQGRCQRCGYSRIGLTADATCPECGWKPEYAT
jgi:hypothetical protein